MIDEVVIPSPEDAHINKELDNEYYCLLAEIYKVILQVIKRRCICRATKCGNEQLRMNSNLWKMTMFGTWFQFLKVQSSI